MYYRTCQFCGDNLDPGEKCNCRDKEEVKRKQLLSLFESDNDGQVRMKLTQPRRWRCWSAMRKASRCAGISSR